MGVGLRYYSSIVYGLGMLFAIKLWISLSLEGKTWCVGATHSLAMPIYCWSLPILLTLGPNYCIINFLWR
jgi:hypothetical protein